MAGHFFCRRMFRSRESTLCAAPSMPPCAMRPTSPMREGSRSTSIRFRAKRLLPSLARFCVRHLTWWRSCAWRSISGSSAYHLQRTGRLNRLAVKCTNSSGPRDSPHSSGANMDSKTDASRTSRQGRLEDEALLRGVGRYAADAPMPGQLYASFVRSPHAFADVRSIDTAAARQVRGVHAVFTAADLKGIGNVSQHPPIAGRGGSKLIVP